MQMEREWPWGLVVLGDPNDTDAVPASLDSNGVARTCSTVVARIQHGVDGPAVASVAMDSEPGGLILVHAGSMVLPGGRLRLGDAAAEQVEEAELPAGEYAVRVLIDELEHPFRVHFALSFSQG